DALHVITTTASKEEAEHIAQAVVARRLAACAQVFGPITSSYHWQGKIETVHEWQCVLKTRQTHYRLLEDAIRELHSYDVHEILASRVPAGSRDYLAWLAGELAELAGPDVV